MKTDKTGLNRFYRLTENQQVEFEILKIWFLNKNPKKTNIHLKIFLSKQNLKNQSNMSYKIHWSTKCVKIVRFSQKPLRFLRTAQFCEKPFGL
jgi:hypothetical protein